MKDSKEKLTKALANFENEYIEFVVLNTIENVVEGGKALEIYANGKVLAVLSEKSSVEPVFHFVVKQSELVKKKTPSKRFRDILWKLQEQKLGRTPTEEEFAKYYKAEYDKICDHYLNKFDDIDIN